MFVHAVSEHQSQLRVQNYISIWVMSLLQIGAYHSTVLYFPLFC